MLIAASRIIDPKFGALSNALCVVALTVDALARSVLTTRRPGDNEAAIGQGCHRGVPLSVGRVGVDLKFGALCHAFFVVALAVNTITRPILPVGLPSNDEAAIGQGSHRADYLRFTRVGVDPEFVALRRTLGVVSLSVDTPDSPVLASGIPRDDEAPIGKPCHHRRPLPVGRVGVDLEFGALSNALGIVSLAVSAPLIPVLPVGRPCDDEAAIGEGGHRGVPLQIGRVCVDLEFGTLCHALCVVALSVDAITRPVLPCGLPCDDEATIGEGGHRGVFLIAGCVGVDPEFRAGGNKSRCSHGVSPLDAVFVRLFA